MDGVMNGELFWAIGAGLGLSAACGLRVFAPLLVLGLAARFGALPVTAGFDWIATTPAIVALGVATVLEIAAYYLPWLDHALDVVATPAAVLAGAVAMVAVLGDLPPWLRWSVGLIAGGGFAGLVQGATVLARLKSLAFTGGLANPVLATGEWIGALMLAAVAVLVPLVGVALVVFALIAVFRLTHRLAFGRRRAAEPRVG